MYSFFWVNPQRINFRRQGIPQKIQHSKEDESLKSRKNRISSHSIQINHQPDETIFHFIILTFVYSLTCFGRFPAHHQELNDCSGCLWFYLRIAVTAVLCLWSGRPAGLPEHEHHDCHHDTKVKPEAVTAVIELLMMGGKTPETC
jgi:hypothetical protein